MFYPERGECWESVCPYGALSLGHGPPHLKREVCRCCADYSCVKIARNPAFEMVSRIVTSDEFVQEALENRPFFEPGGGVTFGGGEPTLQINAVGDVAGRLREAGVHTTIETNGSAQDLAMLFGVMDLMIIDLKCIDEDRHRQWTGMSNQQSLMNIEQAVSQGVNIWIRVPFVPGFNDDEEEQDRIASFLARINHQRPLERIDIMRMHHLGQPKYLALGMEDPMKDIDPPSIAQAQALACRLADLAIQGVLVH